MAAAVTGQTLGCASSYTCELRTRGGAHRVAVLPATQITALSWARQLSATSKAAVTIRPRDRACAALAGAATPWVHELCLWRDSERVWEGPVYDAADDGEQVVITAYDLSHHLAGRIARDGYDTTAVPADVADVAAGMLAGALGPADPGAVRYLRPHPTGVYVARQLAGGTVMAAADLDDLVKLGLDWTVAGRRWHLFGGSSLPLARVGVLDGRHFTGPVPVTRTGQVCTRAVVAGAGVSAVAGGVHPLFGLHERLETSAATSQLAVQAQADSMVFLPQVMLAGTPTITLTPAAPVTVAQLVCGTGALVSGTGAALAETAPCLLSKVAATWDTGGEKIAVTWVSQAGASGDVEAV